MPNDNITRAIKKGTGEIQSETSKSFAMKAPGQCDNADIATDNRNRTAPDIRHLFSSITATWGERLCFLDVQAGEGISINKADMPDEEELFLLAWMVLRTCRMRVTAMISSPLRTISEVEALKRPVLP